MNAKLDWLVGLVIIMFLTSCDDAGLLGNPSFNDASPRKSQSEGQIVNEADAQGNGTNDSQDMVSDESGNTDLDLDLESGTQSSLSHEQESESGMIEGVDGDGNESAETDERDSSEDATQVEEEIGLVFEGREDHKICGERYGQDLANFVVERRGEPFVPAAVNRLVSSDWVNYSSDYSIELLETRGSYLPIDQYSIDDVLIMMPAGDEIGVAGGTNVGETVTFTLPKNAIVLYTPGSYGGQQGFLTPAPDVLNTKVYEVDTDGKQATVTIPRDTGGVRKYLFDYPGLPLRDFSKLSIVELRELGYIKGSKLKFKLAHIVHGAGYVTFNLVVKPCE